MVRMRTLTARQIRAGERLPFGYAISYWRWEVQVAVAHPVGINLLVRWARNLYFVLRKVATGDDMVGKAWHAGYVAGRRMLRADLKVHKALAWDQGWNAAWQRMEDDVKKGFGRREDD